jgi:hypothetical protein
MQSIPALYKKNEAAFDAIQVLKSGLPSAGYRALPGISGTIPGSQALVGPPHMVTDP